MWLPALPDRLPWLAARAALIDYLILAPPLDEHGDMMEVRNITPEALALPGIEQLKVNAPPYPFPLSAP